MSNEKKVLFTRVIMGVLVALVLVVGALAGLNQAKINRLEKQIENLKDVNSSLEQARIENFVILTLIDEIDDEVVTFLVDKTLNMSIYDYLLTTDKFTDSDFDTHNDLDYYFSSGQIGVYYATDVLELMDDPDYYETSEWDGITYTNLVKGLQSIIINSNYTVKRSLS